jgi:hypothetical protein
VGIGLLAGCSNFAVQARKSELATATLADGAMKSWAIYYHAATNNPASLGTTLAEVESAHTNVNRIARDLAAGLAAVDTFATAYETNSATQPALQAAMDALAADASELTGFVATLLGRTNLITQPVVAPAPARIVLPSHPLPIFSPMPGQ